MLNLESKFLIYVGPVHLLNAMLQVSIPSKSRVFLCLSYAVISPCCTFPGWKRVRVRKEALGQEREKAATLLLQEIGHPRPYFPALSTVPADTKAAEIQTPVGLANPLQKASGSHQKEAITCTTECKTSQPCRVEECLQQCNGNQRQRQRQR